MSSWRGRHQKSVWALAAGFLGFFATFCLGQAGPPGGGSALPEAGFVSEGAYYNEYYRFSLDLPQSQERTLIRTPIMPRGGHALLAVKFRNGRAQTEIAINSYDSSSTHVLDPAEAAKKEIVKAERQHLAFDLHPQRLRFKNGLPFHYVEIYRYSEKRITCHLLFLLRGDLVHMTASSTVERQEFRTRLFAAMHFEANAPSVVAQPYLGPTIPDAVVERTIHDEPGQKIPEWSRIEGSVYADERSGVRYRLPTGWKVLEPFAADSLQRFEVIAENVGVATRQRLLFLACSQPLLNASGVTTRPPRIGDARLRLVALDPKCVGLPTSPTLGSDASAESARLLLEYPDFGGVRSSELAVISGARFLIVKSLLPEAVGSDGLQRRITQTAYVLDRGGRLFIWFFIARAESGLPRLDESNLTLFPAN